MTDVPETSREAYREIVEQGEDVALQKRAAAVIAERPRTMDEVADAIPDKSAQSIRPRVTELLRMGCVERPGVRENPSGHEAYVHEITPLGEKYIEGDADPDPEPRLSDLRRRVVKIARRVVRGEADTDVLQLAVERHDEAKSRREPDWNPPGEDGE